MSCNAHRDCPTSCRNWAPCEEPCDHEACEEALAFGEFVDAQRPHVLSADCWCRPTVESVA